MPEQLSLFKVVDSPSKSPVVVIDLWPLETSCCLCGKPLVNPHRCLPIYEGKVEIIYDQWSFFNWVCEGCYNQYEDKIREAM